jgi:hypothetical protein
MAEVWLTTDGRCHPFFPHVRTGPEFYTHPHLICIRFFIREYSGQNAMLARHLQLVPRCVNSWNFLCESNRTSTDFIGISFRYSYDIQHWKSAKYEFQDTSPHKHFHEYNNWQGNSCWQIHLVAELPTTCSTLSACGFTQHNWVLVYSEAMENGCTAQQKICPCMLIV